MNKAEKAIKELQDKYKYNDDIRVDHDAVVDDECEGGSWVTIEEWVYADDEDCECQHRCSPRR